MQIFSFPFKHILQDKFLTEEDFALIKSRITKIKDNSHAQQLKSDVIYNQARISEPELNVTIESSILSNKELIEFYLRYKTKMIGHLNNLSPNKTKLFDTFSFQLSKTAKDVSYPIHDDSAEKLLSVVIYISPEENNGTYLYNQGSSSPDKIVKWKPNRYFAFSRLEGVTRHSYEGNKIDDRYTVVLNLLTSKKNLARWLEPGLRGKKMAIRIYVKNILKKFLKIIGINYN